MSDHQPFCSGMVLRAAWPNWSGRLVSRLATWMYSSWLVGALAMPAAW